jgi:ABC-type glycerol-3-phosphate transport system permease component
MWLNYVIILVIRNCQIKKLKICSTYRYVFYTVISVCVTTTTVITTCCSNKINSYVSAFPKFKGRDSTIFYFIAFL